MIFFSSPEKSCHYMKERIFYEVLLLLYLCVPILRKFVRQKKNVKKLSSYLKQLLWKDRIAFLYFSSQSALNIQLMLYEIVSFIGSISRSIALCVQLTYWVYVYRSLLLFCVTWKGSFCNIVKPGNCYKKEWQQNVIFTPGVLLPFTSFVTPLYFSSNITCATSIKSSSSQSDFCFSIVINIHVQDFLAKVISFSL